MSVRTCRGSGLQTVEGTLGRVVKCVDGWPCENAFGMPSRLLMVARDEGDFCKVSLMVTVTWCVPVRRGYVCECLRVCRRTYNVFVDASAYVYVLKRVHRPKE